MFCSRSDAADAAIPSSVTTTLIATLWNFKKFWSNGSNIFAATGRCMLYVYDGNDNYNSLDHADKHFLTKCICVQYGWKIKVHHINNINIS